GPDRTLVGFGAGNSSVRSIGAAPARPELVTATLSQVRAASPSTVQFLVATDAPRLAAAAGRLADGIIIGTGLDTAAIERALRVVALGAPSAAAAARPRAAGVTTGPARAAAAIGRVARLARTAHEEAEAARAWGLWLSRPLIMAADERGALEARRRAVGVAVS